MKQHHGVDAMQLRPICWVVCKRIFRHGERDMMLTIAQTFESADDWVLKKYPELRRVRSYPTSMSWGTVEDNGYPEKAVARSWVIEHDNGEVFTLHGFQGFVPAFDNNTDDKEVVS